MENRYPPHIGLSEPLFGVADFLDTGKSEIVISSILDVWKIVW